MVKRLLALHGVGSSADILKDQLSALVAELGPDYEFTYLNGAIERERGPGMWPHHHGPFYSYTTGYSPAEIRAALDDIDGFIQDDGPFDGVIAFSQGGGFAASYILDYQARNPNASRQPFQFAVLLSPAAAVSADESCCRSIVDQLLDKNWKDVKSFPRVNCSQMSSEAQIFLSYLGTTLGLAKDLKVLQDIELFKTRAQQHVPRILHPKLTSARISIPVVHFTGKSDWPEMNEQCQVVRRLCESSSIRTYEHNGAHVVPYKKADVLTLVKAIEWAIAETSY